MIDDAPPPLAEPSIHAPRMPRRLERPRPTPPCPGRPGRRTACTTRRRYGRHRIRRGAPRRNTARGNPPSVPCPISRRKAPGADPQPWGDVPLLPLPEIADRVTSPKPLPVRAIVAWPGVFIGPAAIHENAWYAAGPLVPLGEDHGTPEPAPPPGSGYFGAPKLRTRACPIRGDLALCRIQCVHACRSHSRSRERPPPGVMSSGQDGPGRTLRLQRLGPPLCLTKVVMGSDFLLGAFPA